jgi:exonuclease III
LCDNEADSNCNEIKILSLNVCGLISMFRNPDFVESASRYYIICLTETKTDIYDDVSNCLEGFTLLPPVVRQNCKARSGGICVYVKECLCKYVKAYETPNCSSHCVLWGFFC